MTYQSVPVRLLIIQRKAMRAALASKRDCSQPLMIQEFTQLKGGASCHNKSVCICGLCSCRLEDIKSHLSYCLYLLQKIIIIMLTLFFFNCLHFFSKRHHCPVHHSVVAKAIGPKEEYVNTNPLSEYKTVFRHGQSLEENKEQREELKRSSFLPKIENTGTWGTLTTALRQKENLDIGNSKCTEGFPVIKKRNMCPPHPDQLSLFNSKRLDSNTLHKLSYIKWREQPRPSTSCKKSLEYYKSDAPFAGSSMHSTEYKPFPQTAVAAIHNDVIKNAANTSYIYKDGTEMKHVHHFGGSFNNGYAKQSDYFNFTKLRPRVRHGDKSECLYQPSTARFNGVSENKASFIPLDGKPAESCKPLDLRFSKDKQQGTENNEKISNNTSYKDDYLSWKLPQKSICPAELLLISRKL